MTPADPQRVANPYYAYGILHLSENFKRWEAAKGVRYLNYRQGWARRTAALDHGDFPLNINLEVTTRCNLACTFCTQPSLTKAELGDMPWGLYAQVIEEGARYETPAANLNGLGEPTLLKDLPQRIAHAKRHGYIDVMFHTNGTIMTESLARFLIESGLDRIIFSVDSPDKKTYEAMRIHARWEKTVNHVRTFWKVRQEMGRSEPIIRTTMVATEKTILQVPYLVDLWKPVADQITLQDLTWRTKRLEDGTWVNREESAIPTEMDQIREEAIRRKISFVCPYLYQSSYAFWNGDVIPCSNPNARKQMIMGKLDRQSLHEVWVGKPYEELRQLHATGRWHEHPVCRECEVPIVELYKALEKEKNQPLPVASEAVPRRESNTDLVLQLQSRSEVKSE